ncbi:hypothetical protein D3C84_104150 [compost metagenome]
MDNQDTASFAAEIRDVVAELFNDVEWDHSHLSDYTMRLLKAISHGLDDFDTIDAWHTTGLTY